MEPLVYILEVLRKTLIFAGDIEIKNKKLWEKS